MTPASGDRPLTGAEIMRMTRDLDCFAQCLRCGAEVEIDPQRPQCPKCGAEGITR